MDFPIKNGVCLFFSIAMLVHQRVVPIILYYIYIYIYTIEYEWSNGEKNEVDHQSLRVEHQTLDFINNKGIMVHRMYISYEGIVTDSVTLHNTDLTHCSRIYPTTHDLLVIHSPF